MCTRKKPSDVPIGRPDKVKVDKLLVEIVRKQNMEREEEQNMHIRRELFPFLKFCQICYLVCYCSESHRKSCFKLHLTSSYQLYCLKFLVNTLELELSCLS